MPAASLEQALNTFHAAPLRGEDLDRYYVERPLSPLARMAVQLRAQSRLKVLFTGHRIAGKTTALNRLAGELADAFFVVHFSVLDTLNAYDVHYADLMLALATRLLQQATDEKLFPRGVKRLVREDLLEDVLLWLEKRIEGLQFAPLPSEKSLIWRGLMPTCSMMLAVCAAPEREKPGRPAQFPGCATGGQVEHRGSYPPGIARTGLYALVGPAGQNEPRPG